MCELVFFASWIACGCSIETFFDGGAPVVLISLITAVASAAVLAHKRDLKGPHRMRQHPQEPSNISM